MNTRDSKCARECIHLLKRLGLSYRKIARLAGWHPSRVTRVVRREEPASEELESALLEVMQNQLVSKARLIVRLIEHREPRIMTCCDENAVIDSSIKDRLTVATIRALLSSMLRQDSPGIRLPPGFKAVTLSWEIGGGVLDVAYAPPMKTADQLRARAHECEHRGALFRAEADKLDPRSSPKKLKQGF